MWIFLHFQHQYIMSQFINFNIIIQQTNKHWVYDTKASALRTPISTLYKHLSSLSCTLALSEAVLPYSFSVGELSTFKCNSITLRWWICFLLLPTESRCFSCNMFARRLFVYTRSRAHQYVSVREALSNGAWSMTLCAYAQLVCWVLCEFSLVVVFCCLRQHTFSVSDANTKQSHTHSHTHVHLLYVVCD